MSAVASINRRSDGEENDDCLIEVKEEVAASGEGGIDMVDKKRNRCEQFGERSDQRPSTLNKLQMDLIDYDDNNNDGETKQQMKSVSKSNRIFHFDDELSSDSSGDGTLLLDREYIDDDSKSKKKKGISNSSLHVASVIPCDSCDRDIDAKYTCPSCGAKSCSASCVTLHKQQTGCTGKRDRAAAVSAKEYGQPHLEQDYSFLEEVSRSSFAAKRLLRDYGTTVTTVRVPVTQQSNNRGRGGGGGTRQEFEFVQAPARVSTHLHLLLRAARIAGVNLRLMPRGFIRHEENTSKFMVDRSVARKRRKMMTTLVKSSSSSSATVIASEDVGATNSERVTKVTRLKEKRNDGGDDVDLDGEGGEEEDDNDDNDVGNVDNDGKLDMLKDEDEEVGGENIENGVDSAAAIEAINEATDHPLTISSSNPSQPKSSNAEEGFIHDSTSAVTLESIMTEEQRKGESDSADIAVTSTTSSSVLSHPLQASSLHTSSSSSPLYTSSSSSPPPLLPSSTLVGKLMWRVEIEWIDVLIEDAGVLNLAHNKPTPIRTIDSHVHDETEFISIIKPYLLPPLRKGELDKYAQVRRQLKVYSLEAARLVESSIRDKSIDASVLTEETLHNDLLSKSLSSSESRIAIFLRHPYAQSGKTVYKRVNLTHQHQTITSSTLSESESKSTCVTLKSILKGSTVIEYPSFVVALIRDNCDNPEAELNNRFPPLLQVVVVPKIAGIDAPSSSSSFSEVSAFPSSSMQPFHGSGFGYGRGRGRGGGGRGRGGDRGRGGGRGGRGSWRGSSDRGKGWN